MGAYSYLNTDMFIYTEIYENIFHVAIFSTFSLTEIIQKRR
jgi:hypothetical protein